MRSSSFIPNAADLIAANRLLFWCSLKSKSTILSNVAGGLLFAVIGTLIVQCDDILQIITGAILGLFFWSFLLACILAVNYILIAPRSRRAFRQMKVLQVQTHVNWSPEHIQFQSAQGSSVLDWRDLVRIVQGRDVILLFQSDYVFNFIPRRAVLDEQVRDLLEAAAARRM